MPSQLWKLTLFVSSPSDLYPQHQVIQRVIEELDDDLSHLGVRITTQSATRMHPGAASNPQSIINERTKDCDIYLGMMSAKFGEPVNGSGSGTENEFDNALNRYFAEPTSLRLMFYFLQSGDIMDVDPEQLRNVQAFRKKISNRVFWSKVDDTQGFPSVFRRDIMTLIRDEWKNGNWATLEGSPQTESSTPHLATASPDLSAFGNSGTIEQDTDIADEDIGLLDIVARSEESINRATDLLEETGTITRELGQFVSQETAELSNAETTTEKKVIINRVASRMMTVAGRTKQLASDLILEYDVALDGIVSGFSLTMEDEFSSIDKVTIDEIVRALLENEDTMREVTTQVGLYRTAIARMPRATSKMNLAKRVSIDALDDLIASLVLVADKSHEARAKILDITSND